MTTKSALLVLAVLVLTVPIASSAQARSIGYIVPLTGDAAPFGTEVRRGTEIAREELGLQDSQVLFEDEKCSPKDAVSAWRKLADVQHVPVIIGPGCTGSIVAVASAADRSGRPILALWDAGREVETSSPRAYSLGFNSEEEGTLIADYLAKQDLRRVGVFWEEDKFAVLVKERFVERFHTLGGTITASTSVSPGEQELRAVLAKVWEVSQTQSLSLPPTPLSPRSVPCDDLVGKSRS